MTQDDTMNQNHATQNTSETSRRYPREVQMDGLVVNLRKMTSADRENALAFARALPEHDLLFLRRDITKPEAIDVWLNGIERGRISSILTEHEGTVVGYATVDRGELSWSPHVAELRVLVSPKMRGKGLGRLLTQEAFAIALGQGIEKMIAQMTVDQKGAISTFQGMGFRPEALLRDHVKDRSGKKSDLLILSHDVAGYEAQKIGYGFNKAFEE
jgi:L-amino acid N-acyltransferase YncA